MTQDDSHSYCTPEQAPAEIAKLLEFVLGLLRDFGLDDFYLELSTRDPLSDKFIGSDEEWEVATAVLERVATESGLELLDQAERLHRAERPGIEGDRRRAVVHRHVGAHRLLGVVGFCAHGITRSCYCR